MKILSSYQRAKIDETDDVQFYKAPRFTYHLDSNFRKYLTKIYSAEISEDSTILDLMSSWDSHLPPNKSYKKVIGHGLNKEELKRNKSLERYWIQNLNKHMEIPLEDKSIDYCLIVAGWQYLQYPENIAKEISRILSIQGKILISFSNRAFWTKSPNIWTNSNEEDRISYVINILLLNGFKDPRVIRKFISPRNSFFSFINHDPFYCVIATKE